MLCMYKQYRTTSSAQERLQGVRVRFPWKDFLNLDSSPTFLRILLHKGVYEVVYLRLIEL